MSLVTLGVENLEHSVAFYRDVVGWTPEPAPEGVAFFDLGGMILGLYPHVALAGEMKISEKRTGAYEGFSLAHNARTKAEVDAIFASLKAKGATILKEPEEMFWGGYSGYFADLDGHAWEVAFNPFWTVAADGRISMKKA